MNEIKKIISDVYCTSDIIFIILIEWNNKNIVIYYITNYFIERYQIDNQYIFFNYDTNVLFVNAQSDEKYYIGNKILLKFAFG